MVEKYDNDERYFSFNINIKIKETRWIQNVSILNLSLRLLVLNVVIRISGAND